MGNDMEQSEKYRETQAALDAAVRPALWEHGGDVQLLSVGEDGAVTLKMCGQCAGCPGATLVTLPEMEQALRAQLAWLRSVELAAPVSDELLDAARQMLKKA